MVNRVCNCGCDPRDADFADTAGAQRVDMRIVFRDHTDVDRAYVGVGGDVMIREVGIDGFGDNIAGAGARVREIMHGRLFRGIAATMLG